MIKSASKSVPHRFRFGAGPRQRLDVLGIDAEDAQQRADRMRAFIDALRKAGRLEAAVLLARDAAAAKHAREFADIERAAFAAAAQPVADVVAAPALTYREVVRRWLSGELHQRRPKDVERKQERGVKQSWGVFDNHILNFQLCDEHGRPRGAFGDQPIAMLTKRDAQAVKEAIGADYSDGMYKIVCTHIRRPFVLAEMFEFIERSPIPAAFVPPAGSVRVGTYLYPDEDAAYLGHRKHPLVDRVAVGFGARNGMRPGEVEAAVVGDVDLKRRSFTLDKNKTDSPRQWSIEPDCLRALALIIPKGAKPTDKLFPGFVASVNGAKKFREQLRETPGCDRRELYANTDERRPICLHHAMRASFVTVAMSVQGTAEGLHRTDTWIRDRTGHTTLTELEGYRKNARMLSEHEPRWFAPLDQAIPELRKLGALRNVRVNTSDVRLDRAHDGPARPARGAQGVGHKVGQKRQKQAETAQTVSPSWSPKCPVEESVVHKRAQKRGGSRPHDPPMTPPGPPLEGGVGQPGSRELLAAYVAALTAEGDLDAAQGALAAAQQAAQRRRAAPPKNVASLDEARRKQRQ